jgi:exo-beta-1,3-glucanase (GH17 family)
MANAVLGALSPAKLSWIAVGNEVDGMLTNDLQTTAYARFLNGAISHLHRLRPGVKVGTTLTFEGVRKRADRFNRILKEGDVAMVNYYLVDGERRPPATQVPRDLDTMQKYAGSKPLLLTEAGAPSGTVCGSSQAAQAAFVRTLITELRRRRIGYVAYQWMNDVGSKAIEEFGGYYGSRDPAFLDYLATLGLRNQDGVPKPAWTTLTKLLRD